MPDQYYNTGDGMTPVEGGRDSEYSPFSQDEAPGVSLIVLMRIYDVLMAMYTEQNRDGAKTLFELHEKGGIMGSLPAFDPNFILGNEDSV